MSSPQSENKVANRVQVISQIQDVLTRPQKILIVDDIEDNRVLLARLLKRWEYETEMAEDGEQALKMLNQTEFDLVLLDVMMPNMDGDEVLERIKENDKFEELPVVMVTALDDIERAARCISSGADDYLTKPIQPALLKARVTSCLERKRAHDWTNQYQHLIEDDNDVLAERVAEQVQQIASAQLGMIFAMSKLAESRDPETGEHLERMREYCRILAVELKNLPKYSEVITQEFIDDLYSASPLHDIGKVGVPDHILTKQGKLTEDEWEIMRTHPVIGADTLRAVNEQHPGISLIKMGIDISEGHHEKWDGSGYPYGKKGEDIPLSARILALGDAYDAMTTKRCYKEAFSHEKTKQIITEGSTKHFDPDVVQAFLSRENEFVSIKERFKDSET